MIELNLAGEPRVVCDVCRPPITDAGLAAVLRGPGVAPALSIGRRCRGVAGRSGRVRGSQRIAGSGVAADTERAGRNKSDLWYTAVQVPDRGRQTGEKNDQIHRQR
jgi:hypothetical protein